MKESPEKETDQPGQPTPGPFKDAKGTAYYGNPNTWSVVSKAVNAHEGWMKSTKRMSVPGGWVIQVTSEFRDQTGLVTACAEALVFVPHLPNYKPSAVEELTTPTNTP